MNQSLNQQFNQLLTDLIKMDNSKLDHSHDRTTLLRLLHPSFFFKK